MALSLRSQLVWLYAYQNVGTDGLVDERWVLLPSADDHQGWWASVGTPSGREQIAAGKPEQIGDLVIGLAAEVPVPSPARLALRLEDGRVARVLAVQPRTYGTAEQQLHATTSDTAALVLEVP